jgi:hypothetical protein
MGRKSTESREYSKSAGQSKLYKIVQELYPDAQIKQDLNLRKFVQKMGYSWAELSKEYGQTLAPLIADIVLFTPLTIFEYNGEQHYRFTAHWHGNADGFREAMERDNQKIWLCQRMTIPMVIFAFNEEMNLETVKTRIEETCDKVKLLPGHAYCKSCGLVHLTDWLNDDGICVRCVKNARYAQIRDKKNAEISAQKKTQDKELREELKKRVPKISNPELEEAERTRRKKAYQAQKETTSKVLSPELKEKEKSQRKKAYQTQKEKASKILSPELEETAKIKRKEAYQEKKKIMHDSEEFQKQQRVLKERQHERQGVLTESDSYQNIQQANRERRKELYRQQKEWKRTKEEQEKST